MYIHIDNCSYGSLMPIRFMHSCLLLVLTLFSINTFAEVKYISLHEIESTERQPLSLLLNIVESGQAATLRFTLQNQGAETLLEYHRNNDYLLRLKSPHFILGKAQIIAYQLTNNSWLKVAEIDVSNSLVATKEDKVKLITTAKKLTNCTLVREPKETLWSIASRYKERWNIDVFSAMLAIYRSNLDSFTGQHIGLLIDNSELNCPSEEVLSTVGDKPAMKLEFNRLNSRPLN